ncbi:MAG: Rid family detoxifying hydrolase [Candidatus Thioglobus sp.]|jgi:2-iminobutanoate/2-iminopropanoate deaminase|nr:reactive intermediate/imine deaminase [Gammaproteobacteria bacterium]MBQ09840.1 reactive intermediate/imine deaminase [Gammaproteobacteria bacterium]MDP6163081.1 Rid family detoxifying hydrolase [Candidatus Thioglobus sp.]HJL80819.1 Rid family detoxifying hydrolase [Gammaproteobacteria bacterium]HJN01257.1 Rid family detoxifying hydrolase [Gammaproteobacteria bacterium]|tara:strand:+ start:15084 stop:15482 length:399 start_codon:yes stop_codon:yes gene_type:complete
MHKKKIILSDMAPKAIGPYSQGVVSNGHIFLSGQIPLDKNGELLDGAIEKQVELIFDNIRALLETQNCNLQNIVKLTVFLKDIQDFDAVNTKMVELLDEPYPARSLVQAAALPKNVDVEIEVIAGLNENGDR